MPVVVDIDIQNRWFCLLVVTRVMLALDQLTLEKQFNCFSKISNFLNSNSFVKNIRMANTQNLQNIKNRTYQKQNVVSMSENKLKHFNSDLKDKQIVNYNSQCSKTVAIVNLHSKFLHGSWFLVSSSYLCVVTFKALINFQIESVSNRTPDWLSPNHKLWKNLLYNFKVWYGLAPLRCELF